jgi:cold shock CspA family protein
VFVPIALAILLSFVLAPLVGLLQRWHLPRALSVVSVVLLAFTSIFAFFNTDPGFGFILSDDGGPDVFVHLHDVEAAGMKTLVGGQVLVYNTAPARDGRLKDGLCAVFLPS